MKKTIFFITLLLNCSLTPIENVVFVGDSIVDNWNTSYYFNQYNVYNYGVRGDTILGVLEKMPEYLLVKPTKIIILVGTNDTRTIITDYNLEEIADLVINRYSMLISTLEDLKIKYFIIGLLPVNNKWNPSFTDKVNILHEELNSRLKNELSKTKYGCFIDIYSSFTDNSNTLIDYYSSDGVHLTKPGYEILASKVRMYVD